MRYDDAHVLHNGTSMVLVNHEEKFKRLPYQPIIANEVAMANTAAKTAEIINDLIRQHFADDQLDTMPKCECGYWTKGHREGMTCPKCGNPVVRIVNRPLTAQVWMRVPEGISAFISPRFYALFSSYFSTTKFDMLQWLTDPAYVPGNKTVNAVQSPDVVKLTRYLADHGVPRGINNFYDNFDHIMDVVIKPQCLAHKKQNVAPIIADFKELIRRYRDCIFTRWLPFPSRLIFPSEQSGSMTYVDPTMLPAYDAIKTLCSIENSPRILSARSLITSSMRVNRLMVDYHTGFRSERGGGKKGLYRKQLGSTRSPYTARAVIAPIIGPHKYDEVHFPWALSVTLLSAQIINKLMKRKMNPREMFRLIDRHTNDSEGAGAEVLYEVMTTLIRECPEKGIPIQMLRNPTLERLSNQPFRITKIIRNTNIYAVLISVLVIKGPNADFDGDMLQIKLPLDNRERARYARLKSSNGLIDTDRPGRVKGIITLHPELITMVNNYFQANRVI